MLMIGPPGVGKTMLARRLPGLLPALDEETALEVTRVHSAAGVLRPGSGAIRRPPFRAPHHGASAPALVGGGSGPRPGEISLATGGVLFLDELTEFSRSALEALAAAARGRRAGRRARGRARALPGARAARGGGEPVPVRRARRLHLHEPSASSATARASAGRWSTASISSCASTRPIRRRSPATGRRRRRSSRRAWRAARDWQAARGQKIPNARLELAELERLGIAPDARELLERAAVAGRLSARRQVRVLRLARSVADLAGSGGVAREHVAEALALVPRGRGIG